MITFFAVFTICIIGIAFFIFLHWVLDKTGELRYEAIDIYFDQSSSLIGKYTEGDHNSLYVLFSDEFPKLSDEVLPDFDSLMKPKYWFHTKVEDFDEYHDYQRRLKAFKEKYNC